MIIHPSPIRQLLDALDMTVEHIKSVDSRAFFATVVCSSRPYDIMWSIAHLLALTAVLVMPSHAHDGITQIYKPVDNMSILKGQPKGFTTKIGTPVISRNSRVCD
jgi:hypothetical protein